MHHSLLASGSFDETVKLFDIRSGECVSTLPAHSDPVTAVAFNRDGTCVASASHDGLIRIWDVGTSECLKTIFASGNPPVASVAYSPNGKVGPRRPSR
jgi:COMPASS component SWD3